ncbi:23S rRNA (pseudouridine(1915)-N(3))-methyltransferase RlmH [Desulfovibrio sp. OttesenSCG-928-O18]|nr:23S rRNA (pseudouridine(1915)-N(3))-methyltransferase RlmH [Desulfovibrio sp. OttesenSCG-928-O18]
MPQIQIIAVGRLKEPHWKSAAEAYGKRLKHGYDLAETIVKDGDASLSPTERAAVEGERILQAIKGNVMPVCLDENGDTLSSVAFADFLRRSFDGARTPCFIIGGAYGLSEAVRGRAVKTLSFGPMTFPHELARVLLLEQLYRADTIIRGRPYHHA